MLKNYKQKIKKELKLHYSFFNLYKKNKTQATTLTENSDFSSFTKKPERSSEVYLIF